MKKLVLAYSGGLDTSYCLRSLSQEGYEIHAVSVNTGGFPSEELQAMESRLRQTVLLSKIEEKPMKIVRYYC